MSNCCFCSFEIKFSNINEKNSFFKDFKDEILEDNELIFMGTKERPLYAPNIVDSSIKDNNTLYLSCWVDWAIEHEDMINFVYYIQNNHDKQYNIERIKTDYEELMDDVLGSYLFDGKTLYDRFLTNKQISDIYNKSDYSKEEYQDDEEALDDYHNALYKELDDNPTIIIVKTY